jgi:hypothetical protein
MRPSSTGARSSRTRVEGPGGGPFDRTALERVLAGPTYDASSRQRSTSVPVALVEIMFPSASTVALTRPV